jgi:hypothetical protein
MTHNVTMYIENSEYLRNGMSDYVQNAQSPTYLGWVEWMGLERQETPDGVQWDGNMLDYDELDALVATWSRESRDMTPAEKLADAIHGAKYCHYDAIHNTLIVWYGGWTFNVLSVATGEVVALWTNISDADVAQAEQRIRYVVSAHFKQDNGANYLEAYAV